jgi:iron complex transport system substrate-binding protein
VRAPWIAIALVAVACGGGKRDEPAPAPALAPAAGSAAATLDAAPARPRVVSLTPSATEVVGALGATELLVGVDDYSTYPEAVKSLPKVGSFIAPNTEAIAKLQPTLVIVDDVHARAAKGFTELGIPTIACPMHSLPDVKAALTRVGGAVGREAEAARLVGVIDAALDAAAAGRQAGERPRVLIVLDRVKGGLGGLVAAGPGSWLDELVAVIGGENALAGAAVRYPKISREEILRARPDVIIDAAYVADPSAPVDDWKELDVPAVKTRRVYAAKEPYLLAPSPRVREALDRVAAMLRQPM